MNSIPHTQIDLDDDTSNKSRRTGEGNRGRGGTGCVEERIPGRPAVGRCQRDSCLVLFRRRQAVGSHDGAGGGGAPGCTDVSTDISVAPEVRRCGSGQLSLEGAEVSLLAFSLPRHRGLLSRLCAPRPFPALPRFISVVARTQAIVVPADG